MKNFLLKLKILKTNISRIIISFLFINVISLLPNISREALGLEIDFNTITCYERGPGYDDVSASNENIVKTLVNIFIMLVPIAVLILVILAIINKKKKQKNIKKEKKDVKKN